MSLEIGDTLWEFDANRRVYKPPPKGRIWSTEGPIFEEHFRPQKITGETKGCWLAGYAKINKRTLRSPASGGHSGNQWYTAEGREDRIWDQSHRIAIADAVRRCTTEQLRQIAKLMDYKP